MHERSRRKAAQLLNRLRLIVGLSWIEWCQFLKQKTRMCTGNVATSGCVNLRNGDEAKLFTIFAAVVYKRSTADITTPCRQRYGFTLRVIIRWHDNSYALY